jgi:hypothetical protein
MGEHDGHREGRYVGGQPSCERLLFYQLVSAHGPALLQRSLGDAAARSAGRRRDPERLEARRQLSAIGWGKPQAQQEPISVRPVFILVRRAAVIDDVVVE